MNRSTPLKAVALLSSVVLVGGYLLYQSGAEVLPGSKSGRLMLPTSAPSTGPAGQSSSYVVGTLTATSATSQPGRKFFPGSKSFAVMRPEDLAAGAAITLTPATQPAKP